MLISFICFYQGDVQPNLNRARSSVDNRTEKTDDKKNAPRRSERLSMAREAATESKQTLGKSLALEQAKRDELNKRNQDKKPVQRSSAPPDEESAERNELPAQKNGEGRQNVRHRTIPEVLPSHLKVTRKASRRLSDEFDDIPTKRARHINFLIRQKQHCDCRPQEHHNLSLTNFEPTKYTSGFSPYDSSIRGDVLQSPEYVSDIFQRLYHSEVSSLRMRNVQLICHNSNVNLTCNLSL